MARRFGCLGCILQSLLVFVLAGIGYLAITAVFAPWAFFLGGHFHPLPYWNGWGVLHTSDRGDYAIYVQFEPKPTGAHSNGAPYMSGNGYLCTPRGEKLWMYVTATMPKGIGMHPDGQPITVGMDYWPALTGQFMGDHRPSVGVRGRWEGDTIVGNDNKSLTNAFDRDGSVYRGHDPNRPNSTELIQVTLTEGSTSAFNAACAALRRR
jgi:hypothetical protein